MYQQGVFINMQKNVAVEGELLQIKGHRSRAKGGCDNLSCTESLSKPLLSAAVPNLPLNSLLWLCLRDLSVFAETTAEGHTEHLLYFALKWVQSSPTVGSKRYFPLTDTTDIPS